MPRRLPLGALLLAAVIAVAGWTPAPAGGEPAPIPAPPPATCRTPPPAGWGDYAADPATKDLAPFQDYREALGIGPGTRGEGVTLADVEYEWRETHVELAGRGLPAPPANTLPESFRSADHGSAVLGMLGGSPDGQGITGLVAGAEIRPFSPYATGAYDPVGAIEAATRDLGPGDVMLIELQAQLSRGAPYLPIEAYDTVEQPVRTVIANAVRKGVVVVEPAGNGDVDIGAAGIPWLRGPGDSRYSGALIVGAGGSPSVDGSSDLEWVSSSNYGARVDVQGVGVGVVTSGYGNGPDPIGGIGDRAYTACFDGTSSASATVAAAVVALQSAAIARGRAPLTPDQVRAILRQTGAPQGGTGTERPIGPRPRVAAAVASLDGVPPPGDSPVPAPSPGPLVAGGAPIVPVISGTADRPPRPAASGATARYVRAGGRLTIRFRGLVKGARVTARGHRAKVVRNAVVLRRVKPGRFVVVVTVPARLRARYATMRVVVVVAKRGTAKVVRLPA